jgi:hypothetical protein
VHSRYSTTNFATAYCDEQKLYISHSLQTILADKVILQQEQQQQQQQHAHKYRIATRFTQVFVPGILPHEVAALAAAFDTDGSGSVSIEELTALVRSVELKGGDAPLPSSLLATSAPRGRGLHSSPPSTAWGGSVRGGSVAGGRPVSAASIYSTTSRRPGTAVSRIETTSTFKDRLRRFQVGNDTASLLC